MSCAPLAILLSAAAVLTATGSAAEAAREVPATADRPPILEATVATPPPAAPVEAPAPRPRLVSNTVAAQLAVAVPKFEPPPADPAPSPASETSPDLRETDKPKNTIVRLPRYLVQEDRPPVFKERELYTPKERLRLALQKHPGLRLGSFWIFRNDGIALFMAAEEKRLEQKREFEDLVSLLKFTDPPQHAATKRHVEQAFLREADFGR